MPSPVAAMERLRQGNKFLAVKTPPHLRTPPYANPHSSLNTPKGRQPVNTGGTEITASVRAVEKLVGGAPPTVRKGLVSRYQPDTPENFQGGTASVSITWRNVSNYRIPEKEYRIISRSEATVSNGHRCLDVVCTIIDTEHFAAPVCQPAAYELRVQAPAWLRQLGQGLRDQMSRGYRQGCQDRS